MRETEKERQTQRVKNRERQREKDRDREKKIETERKRYIVCMRERYKERQRVIERDKFKIYFYSNLFNFRRQREQRQTDIEIILKNIKDVLKRDSHKKAGKENVYLKVITK